MSNRYEKKYMMSGLQRWKYTVSRYSNRKDDRYEDEFDVNQYDEDGEMNKMGDEGWELINVVPVKVKDEDGIERTDVRYYWKRPSQIETRDNRLI